MRVLVSRLSSLGDVVCTLPVATAVKATWPGSEVVWIVDKRFRGIVECCSSVDSVVARPDNPLAVRDLGTFDAALDMQGLFKSGILVGLARAKTKLGYHWQREGAWLFSRRVIPDRTSHHVVDQYVDVVRALGADAGRADFGLAPRGEDLVVVRARLAERGWTSGALVLCNAGAGWATKRWDSAHYAALCDLLSAHGVAVAFLGSAVDRGAFDEVRALARSHLIDMVGHTDVKELVALVSLATVHVGGDTGSTHIAAALGVPAVAVYPMTRPERSCPYGQVQNCFSTAQGPVEPDVVIDAVLRNLGSLAP